MKRMMLGEETRQPAVTPHRLVWNQKTESEYLEDILGLFCTGCCVVSLSKSWWPVWVARRLPACFGISAWIANEVNQVLTTSIYSLWNGDKEWSVSLLQSWKLWLTVLLISSGLRVTTMEKHVKSNGLSLAQRWRRDQSYKEQAKTVSFSDSQVNQNFEGLSLKTSVIPGMEQ